MSTCSSCILRFREIIKNNDKNLVDGRGALKVRGELSTLNFNIQSKSPYICKSCVGQLKKRRGIIDNIEKIEAEISALHQSSKKREISKVSGTSDCELSPSKRQATQEITLTSTAVKSCGYFTLEQPLCFSPSSPIPGTHKKETVVQVQVDWPSKTKVNILKEGLESLGKMLCRGTYSQIANAVCMETSHLKKHMQQLFLKQIDSECSQR